MDTSKVLGIDFGTKKIGLALLVGNVISPLEILENRENHQIGEEAINNILQYIKSESILIVVIGLPVTKESNYVEVRKIREFGNRIKKLSKSNIDITYIDESYTSKEANYKAIEYGISQKNRNMDDAIAACQILGRYLEAHSLPNQAE